MPPSARAIGVRAIRAKAYRASSSVRAAWNFRSNEGTASTVIGVMIMRSLSCRKLDRGYPGWIESPSSGAWDSGMPRRRRDDLWCGPFGGDDRDQPDPLTFHVEHLGSAT